MSKRIEMIPTPNPLHTSLNLGSELDIAHSKIAALRLRIERLKSEVEFHKEHAANWERNCKYATDLVATLTSERDAANEKASELEKEVERWKALCKPNLNAIPPVEDRYWDCAKCGCCNLKFRTTCVECGRLRTT
jgi:chromosome segregation ATPase